MDEKVAKVVDRMKRLCSRREYCRKDIYRKVCEALDGDIEQTEKIVDGLVREKYVDDPRYSSAFARDKSSLAGWGTVKIRHALSLKGISRDDISSALKEIDEAKAKTRLERLIDNKYRNLKDDPQWKMKLLRFGLGRGYEYDAVSEVINGICRDNR